jgi:hypothetical protein
MAGASDGGDIFQRVNRAAAAHNNESKAAEAAAADENAAPVEDMAAAEDQQPVTLADILKRNKERQDANTAGAQESASVEGAGQEQTSERGQQVA